MVTVFLQISPPPEWLQSWLDVILSLFAVIISYLLYRLYGQQKELLAANHKAILSGKLIDSEALQSTIGLSNHGNGIAKDIRLTTYFTVPEEFEDKYSAVGVYLIKEGQEGVEGAVLQPGEEQEFNCLPKIGVRETEDPDSWDTKWLLSAFDEMAEDGIEEIKYCFVAEYNEFTEESQTVVITPFVASIDLQNERYNGYPSNLEVMAENRQESKDVFPEVLSDHRLHLSRRDKIRIRLHRFRKMLKL